MWVGLYRLWMSWRCPLPKWIVGGTHHVGSVASIKTYLRICEIPMLQRTRQPIRLQLGTLNLANERIHGGGTIAAHIRPIRPQCRTPPPLFIAATHTSESNIMCLFYETSKVMSKSSLMLQCHFKKLVQPKSSYVCQPAESKYRMGDAVNSEM